MGDCLELMKGMADKSVDCFICDLPYGQLASGGIQTNAELKKKYKRKDTHAIGGCPWDVKIDLVEFWTQVKRLCRNEHTPVLMFCNTKFGYELIHSNPDWFRYDLVWDKQRGVSFLSANKMPMKSHEMIYVFSKKGAYYKRIDNQTDKKDWKLDYTRGSKAITSRQYGADREVNVLREGKGGTRCPLSVLQFTSSVRSGLHPTEKPMELYKWLLSRYCPDGGTVLDPTAGSFNAIFACQEMGLKGIGIEKDKKFFYTAVAKQLQRTRTPAPAPAPAPVARNEIITP